ncbi:ferroxidase fet3 [Dipsacomyces acuminosporus]|nr:ferroxidase fet3 [Dipsacomyces acuminosporus]
MNGYLLVLHLLVAVLEAARVEYNWAITAFNTTVDGVHERLAIGVDGRLPMPTVRAEMGDLLVLRLRNNLTEPTGLHSHGILNNGTNYYDGAGMITECGIAPGSELAYEIPLHQTGTYWLHGHHGMQYMNGLRGPMIITDPDGEPYSYDADIVLTFEDWPLTASTEGMMGGGEHHAHQNPPDQPQRAWKDRNPEYEPGGQRNNGAKEDGMSGMPGASNTTNTPNMNSTATAPKLRYPLGLINGADAAKPPTLNFEPGKTYRIRLLNTGAGPMFRFGIENHDMYIIEVDGTNTEKQKVCSVVIATAQRVSVLVTAKPSANMNYRYRFDMLTDVFPQSPGLNPHPYSGTVVYSDGAPFNKRNDVVWEEFDDINLVPLDRQPLLEPNRIQDVNITADRVGSHLMHTFINNISFSLPSMPSILTALSYNGARPDPQLFGRDCNPHIFDHMDVVELRVQNFDSVKHPMHLHGHYFQIVERGTIGVPSSAVRSRDSPMRRDTTIVPPNKYAVLRFRIDNPGVWMFHCHIEKHMSLGLSMLFVSAPNKIRESMSIPRSMREQCRMLGFPV